VVYAAFFAATVIHAILRPAEAVNWSSAVAAEEAFTSTEQPLISRRASAFIILLSKLLDKSPLFEITNHLTLFLYLVCTIKQAEFVVFIIPSW
jgi:hypothetical protein